MLSADNSSRVQTYVRHLQRHADAIKICEECLPLADDPHVRSRVYLYRGVAEAALCRTSRYSVSLSGRIVPSSSVHFDIIGLNLFY